MENGNLLEFQYVGANYALIALASSSPKAEAKPPKPSASAQGTPQFYKP